MIEQITNFASGAAQYAVPFIVILSVVVFAHEFGHFWVARRCGVKVDSFSIGFGREIFGWNDKHGTHVTLREKGDYNILAVFNPITKLVYFINDIEFNNTTAIILRLTPPKNNQSCKVRLAENYLICNPPLSTVSHTKSPYKPLMFIV